MPQALAAARTRLVLPHLHIYICGLQSRGSKEKKRGGRKEEEKG
jgi:hypothetical protein